MAVRPSFFAELKRRNVLRAGVLYAGAAWALSQGIAQLGPLFDAPNWAMRAFVIACVIGFPFWVSFAWFYEFTPQGIRRESEVAPNAAMTHSTARKLDFAIIGVLIVAVVAFRRAKTTENPMKPQAASSLVTAGVYKITRNPMYLGLSLVILGWAVFLWSAWVLLGPIVFMAYIARFQIAPEERVLASLFGREYSAYKAKVRRWL